MKCHPLTFFHVYSSIQKHLLHLLILLMKTMKKNYLFYTFLSVCCLFFSALNTQAQNQFFSNFTTQPPPSTAVVPDYSYLPGTPLVVGSNNFATRTFFYNHLFANGNPTYPRFYCTNDLPFGYDYWKLTNPGYWGTYANQKFDLTFYNYTSQGPQASTGIDLAQAQSTSTDYYYTLRVRLNGINDTEGIIFKTFGEPSYFYDIAHTPATTSVPVNTPVTVTFERSVVNGHNYYVKYSNDNWLTYNLAPVTFTSSVFGSAVIPGFATPQVQVSYFPISSNINLTTIPVGDDINLYTLTDGYAPTQFYSVTGNGASFTNVTFKVDMSNQVVDPSGVYLAGSFNNWNLNQNPLTPVGNNIYETTIPVNSNTTITYKFLNGSNYETVSGACTMDDGFGNTNRFFNVPSTNTATINTACFESCNGCIAGAISNVTFRVNMSNETVSPDGVFLCGTFNGFTIGLDPMVNVGANIWEKTITVAQGAVIDYKFVNGANWESVPSTCGTPDIVGIINRNYTVPNNSNSTVGTFCFNECTNCSAQANTLVKFSVNLATQTVSPDGVFLAGTFNGFSPIANPMINVGGGLFELILPLPQNTAYTYKFVNGSNFENVPFACGQDDGGGIFNRTVTTTNNATLNLNTVCFNECNNCTSSNITFTVDMANVTVSPQGVFLAGSFNSFSTTQNPMTNVGNNIYATTITLLANTQVIYKFVNGTNFELVTADCGIMGSQTVYDRVLQVPPQSTTLPAPCFDLCFACTPSFTFSNVTLRVDMSNQTVSPGGVFVAGNFNNWNTTLNPMTNIGNNIYETTITVPSGSDISYKFLNGANYEIVNGACTVSDGMGNFNRTYTSPISGNTTLNTVCYETCAACLGTNFCDVTLSVDMGLQTIAPTGVFVLGSFNGFTNGVDALINTNGTIWEKTISVAQGTNITYRFANGNNVEVVPSSCGTLDNNNNYNRSYSVPNTNNALVNTVCFQECGNCNIANITFTVDMSNVVVDPAGVFIAGSFNGFSTTQNPLVLLGNNIYAVSIPLQANTQVIYKFINGSTYELVTADCGVLGSASVYDRVLQVPAQNTMLNAPCFNSCFACTTVGNKTTDSNNLLIAPNPADQFLYVSFQNKSVNIYQYSILNNVGQIIKKGSLTSNQLEVIDIHEIPAGIYFLQINANNNIQFKKFVVVSK
jgi:1,4-alpha-glucan branching enzyme